MIKKTFRIYVNVHLANGNSDYLQLDLSSLEDAKRLENFLKTALGNRVGITVGESLTCELNGVTLDRELMTIIRRLLLEGSKLMAVNLLVYVTKCTFQEGKDFIKDLLKAEPSMDKTVEDKIKEPAAQQATKDQSAKSTIPPGNSQKEDPAHKAHVMLMNNRLNNLINVLMRGIYPYR